MASELEIDPEFEDEDEFVQNLKDKIDSTKDRPQSTDNPQLVNDLPNLAQNLAKFDPSRRAKDKEKEVAKAQREARRRQREQQQEQRRQLQQRYQDEARIRKEALREQKQLSKDEVTAARADAISGRVQAYSAAAALGFPGYVIGSAVDALYIRPQEEKRVQEQNEYQEKLRQYKALQEQEEIFRKRQEEEAIRNTPIDATPIDETGRPTQVSGPPKPPPPPPGAPPGGQRDGPPPPQEPPLLPPVRPVPTKGFGTQFAAPIATVTTAFLIGKAINSAISNISQGVSTTANSIINSSASQGALTSAKATQSFVDPFNVNIPINVAVEGFSSLLNINESILEGIKKSVAFSPQTLQADVQGQILQLGKQIEVAQKLDRVSANIVEANTNFNLAFAEFRATFIRSLAPFIVTSLKHITAVLNLINSTILATSAILRLTVIGNLLKSILNILEKDKAKDLNKSDVVNQIDRFFDVDLQIGKTPRNSIPNP